MATIVQEFVKLRGMQDCLSTGPGMLECLSVILLN
jgi:hypothetical protein